MGIRAYKDLVVGTHPDKLELHARVIELRFGASYTYAQILAATGLGMNTINNIINKYSPKQTGRDLVILISSKLNDYETTTNTQGSLLEAKDLGESNEKV